MWKTSTIAICALALSGSFAMAQTYNQGPNQSPSWMPASSGNSPNGANGPAPVRDIGGATANANQTADGRSSSTSMLSQSNKAQSAAGMSGSNYGNGPVATNSRYYDGSQAQMQNGREASCGSTGMAAITDEYGHKYNCRGDRLRR